jgi:hypothetical protein
MASHDIPLEIASTLQTASINRNPDVRHDLNPSTAASSKEPVTLHEEASSDLDDEIPISALRPMPRRQTMPPLPDLRFEQSYLKSIEKADGWGQVGYITIRDQVGITKKEYRRIEADCLVCFTISTGRGMVSRSLRLETLESRQPILGRDCGS